MPKKKVPEVPEASEVDEPKKKVPKVPEVDEQKTKVPKVPDETEELVKIEQLKVGSRAINTIVKVDSKSEVREVFSRRDGSTNRVVDALVGDETACLYLTLWNESVDGVNEGDTLKIKNAYITLFKGSMRLNLGRYGSFEVLEDSPISTINTENNLSSKQYEQERRFRPSYGSRGYGGGSRGSYRRPRR